jgi:hypothetical protein
MLGSLADIGVEKVSDTLIDQLREKGWRDEELTPPRVGAVDLAAEVSLSARLCRERRERARFCDDSQ